MIYLWLKAGHIIFVIFWMAGLFMLPRLFIYHQEEAPESDANIGWIEREKRLLRIILWPSFAVAWIFGLALAWVSGAYVQGWFAIKLVFVLALSGFHLWMARYAANLARGDRGLDGKRLRLINEVPGIAIVLIVISVVVLRNL